MTKAFQTFQTVVQKTERLSEDILDVYIQLKTPETIDFTAGQFVTISLINKDGKNITRAYTIASPPYEKNILRIVYKMKPTGSLTPFFTNLKSGDNVEIKGPYGIFVFNKKTTLPSVFICTGVGNTPFLSILQDLAKKEYNKEIILLWGDRHEDDLYCIHELEELKKKLPHFSYEYILSHPKKNKNKADTGWVQTLLPKHIKDISYEYYLCGNKEMVEEIRKKLKEKETPKKHIHYEKFW